MAKNAPSRPKGTVLFCGAGLSVPIGYPVTNEIFSRIVSAINNNHLFGGYDTGHRERKCLKKLLYLLFPILERSRRLPDCLSICSVLSLIDHMASAEANTDPQMANQGFAGIAVLAGTGHRLGDRKPGIEYAQGRRI